MEIRPAILSDAKRICFIANEVRLNYDMPQKSGFLVYGLSEEKYAHRIDKSRYFYVAEKEGIVEAFFMCYDKKTLMMLASEKCLDHENGIVKFLFAQKEDFIFGDQIAVSNECKRGGAGRELMYMLFSDMKQNKIQMMYAAILHRPVKNKASIEFCSALGFEALAEVNNKDDYIWGMYRKRIGL
jgi:predicted GNAT superfamily acetyltransferase